LATFLKNNPKVPFFFIGPVGNETLLFLDAREKYCLFSFVTICLPILIIFGWPGAGDINLSVIGLSINLKSNIFC